MNPIECISFREYHDNVIQEESNLENFILKPAFIKYITIHYKSSWSGFVTKYTMPSFKVVHTLIQFKRRMLPNRLLSIKGGTCNPTPLVHQDMTKKTTFYETKRRDNSSKV